MPQIELIYDADCPNVPKAEEIAAALKSPGGAIGESSQSQTRS